jgi:hypothetical protein
MSDFEGRIPFFRCLSGRDAANGKERRTDAGARKFEARAQKMVDDAVEPLAARPYFCLASSSLAIIAEGPPCM